MKISELELGEIYRDKDHCIFKYLDSNSHKNTYINIRDRVAAELDQAETILDKLQEVVKIFS